MDLGEVGEFLDDGALSFSIGGRRYTVPPVEWPTYLRFMADLEHAGKVAVGAAELKDAPSSSQTVEEFWTEVLTKPVLDELVANRVPGPTISVLVRGAHLFHMGQTEAAKVIIQGAGKAPAPMESTSTTPTGSTGTGAASTTPRRGSTSGTRSPRKSSKQNAPAGKR